MIQIKIKKTKNIEIPHLATAGSAAFDLVNTNGDLTLLPGDRVNIDCGFQIEIPQYHFGLIRPRSGLATKKGLDICTSGVIDSDYRGVVFVTLINHGNIPQDIKNMDKVAQMIIIPIPSLSIIETAELSSTERGSGGFGSTDKPTKVVSELEKRAIESGMGEVIVN